jgi:hypothetical protein
VEEGVVEDDDDEKCWEGEEGYIIVDMVLEEGEGRSVVVDEKGN